MSNTFGGKKEGPPLLYDSLQKRAGLDEPHGCFSGAIARVIGRLFPDFADAMEERAAEAVKSRFWSGIHFRSDVDSGLVIGRNVGDLVMEPQATVSKNQLQPELYLP